ncbi:hypothetical protein MTR_1g078010 [Medicago truncatula]|uniref:Uncharacterized protein n=1 Tax=Medicago truncatula TaxID=3880 RepID=A0A072VXY5_MEDTR|nr:hypothetical protein MTR_1g078010 [Medicago truncatula]
MGYMTFSMQIILLGEGGPFSTVEDDSILPFYAINLGVVSLFTDSPFTFLAMFPSDVIYRFE